MKVKLVGYTQPAEEFKDDFNSAKELIAFCARVSNPSNQFNNDTADKLLKYLLKHKHFSPFEMASATIEIETTRDIARQILRHRSFAFQEFSQRYADPVEDLSFMVRQARLQDTKNRQNSIVLDLTNPEHREINKLWFEKQQDVIRTATAAYTWAVTNGIAKEQARVVLPEGNTMSRLYMQGTIRSFIHYVEVRSDQSTQAEHREIALAVAQAISKIFDFQGLQ
jgi:thymidylate synthase (FAD)